MKRMKKISIILLLAAAFIHKSFAQAKINIGILPFKNSSEQTGYYGRTTGQNKETAAIQDAVTDAFMKTKRFSMVEREKMDQIKSEKNLQKNEDFIDGKVIEQSKSIGAQYIVLGNISKAEDKTSQAWAPVVGRVATHSYDLAFNIKVVDVSTGEIMATNSFSAKKKSLESALEEVKPDIEKFIKENFKITVSVASVEEKNNKGEAVKLLIAGGSSVGMKEANVLKVYEVTELLVDGKKLERKVTVGKIMVAKVEDENFSVCNVTEGGDVIAKKFEANAKLKCETINE